MNAWKRKASKYNDQPLLILECIIIFCLISIPINQYVISKFRFLFLALGGLLFGYDIGATSGATISLQVNFLFNVF